MAPHSIRLLITDLDNTLFDWVTYFARAFDAMTKELVPLLGIDESTLLNEFKTLHQHYGNSEQPFVVFELPSVRKRFGTSSTTELKEKLQPALYAFNRTRKQTLRLYDSVDRTLRELRRRDVMIVGHTEALAINAYDRLRRLDIADCFQRLYAIEGRVIPHPDPKREADLAPPAGLIQVVPKSERKPNPRLLQDICSREGILPSEAVYIGDSLTRDISMAKAAGVVSVWARYGTEYQLEFWNILVRVTHWTDDDVRRENELKRSFGPIEPDHTINSFGELLRLDDIEWGTQTEAGTEVPSCGRSARAGFLRY